MKALFSIKQIVLTGIFTAAAILIGSFVHFPIFGSNVYLIGAVIFLMPIVLKMPFAIIGASISVVLSDLTTGWIAYTWISIIAYVGGVIIIKLFSYLHFKFIYVIGVLVASLFAIATYFITMNIFDKAQAFSELWTDLIQFAIVLPIVIILYRPIKIISILK